ncbi:hypothetical protein, partial [Vibrio parahaemolyticus]
IEKLNQICDNDHDLLSTRFDEMKHELDTLRSVEAKLKYEEQSNSQRDKIISAERLKQREKQKELHRHNDESKSAENAL